MGSGPGVGADDGDVAGVDIDRLDIVEGFGLGIDRWWAGDPAAPDHDQGGEGQQQSAEQDQGTKGMGGGMEAALIDCQAQLFRYLSPQLADGQRVSHSGQRRWIIIMQGPLGGGDQRLPGDQT